MNETDKAQFKALLKEGSAWQEKVRKFLEREIVPNNVVVWQESEILLRGPIEKSIDDLRKLFIEEKSPTPHDLLYWLQKIKVAAERAEKLYPVDRYR